LALGSVAIPGAEAFMNEDTDLMLEEVSDWILSLDYVCRSEEIRELIRHLEQEHGAYPQVLVNIDEN
jgi:hypothetical protein